ncbi:MAG: tetratricopeptide repeat protein, partial [Myxococcota bacterium]
PARGSHRRLALGADALVVGSYTVSGPQATIEWQIAGTKSPPQTLEVSLFDASKAAYGIGESVLKALANGYVSESPLPLAADAAEAWGTALAGLARQSRDPRASVVLRKADRTSVLAALDTVTKTEATFAPAWATRAAVASMGSETEEQVAMNATKAALNSSSADPSAAISLYYSQQHLAEQSEARQTLVEALKTYPGSLEVMNYLAQAYYLAGDFEECLTVWDDYLKRVPKSLHASRRRGKTLAKLDRRDEAVAAAKKLAEANPESLPTMAALASRQIDAGQMEIAKATLTEQLQKHPDHPLLLTRLSYIELESGSADRALALARKAVEQLGDGRGERLAGYAHIDLARALALTGKRGEARESLKKSLRLGVSGDDVFRLATDPRLQGFIKLPIVLNPED